jgi:transcriptional regulator GlxA family with amidase domain
VDVLLHANRYNDSRYKIYTVAHTTGPVLCENNFVSLKPDFSIHNCEDPDVIIIPGIAVIPGEKPKIVPPEIIEWIKVKGHEGKTLMSVCVGAFTLAATGLLDGRQATTHYLSIKEFEGKFKHVQVIRNVRYIVDGKFITTGGVTSGIDGALYLVAANDNDIVAQQTADCLIYNRDAPLPPYTLLPPYNTI